MNGAELKEREIDRLLSIQQLETFLQNMKDEMAFKPSTRKDKLWKIRLAIKYVIRTADDKLYYKGQRVIDAIEEWCHGLGKDIAEQRREHGLLIREKMEDLTDPNEFLDDEQVQPLLTTALFCLILSFTR